MWRLGEGTTEPWADGGEEDYRKVLLTNVGEQEREDDGIGLDGDVHEEHTDDGIGLGGCDGLDVLHELMAGGHGL